VANFQKHIEISTIGSGIASTVLFGAGLINYIEVMTLWIAGAFGGILPDIDSDNSTTIKIIFFVISAISICIGLSQLPLSTSTLEIWLFIIVCYAIINFIVSPLFKSLTVHRGVFHSLLGGVFFGLLSVVSAYQLTGLNNFMSWLMGFFIFLGYLIHLTLDEVYSVDFMNARIKRSFGTALKLFSYNNVKTSSLMLIVTVALCFLTPSLNSFNHSAEKKQVYNKIKDSFLPLALSKGPLFTP